MKTIRTHKARGVSLPLDVDERVEQRLKELRPRVKGFSHYVQLLVDWDLRREKPLADRKPDQVPFRPVQLPLELDLVA